MDACLYVLSAATISDVPASLQENLEEPGGMQEICGRLAELEASQNSTE